MIRNSQLHQISAIKLEIVVSGDSQRRVGEVVNLKIPTVEETGGRLDELLSGRYLICKIKHDISSTEHGYNTIMMLVKDSWANPLPVKA